MNGYTDFEMVLESKPWQCFTDVLDVYYYPIVQFFIRLFIFYSTETFLLILRNCQTLQWVTDLSIQRVRGARARFRRYT
jgi:hypothetical protein